MTKTEKQILYFEENYGSKFSDLPTYAQEQVKCDIEHEKGLLTDEECLSKKMKLLSNYINENIHLLK